MGEFPGKSDGRRVFTVEFKRGVVQQHQILLTSYQGTRDARDAQIRTLTAR